MATPLRDRRLARLGLLIAAALHLLGGGLLSPLHAIPAGDGVVAVDVRHDGDSSQLPPAHDEDHCALCHIGGATALPSGGASTVHVAVAKVPAAAASAAPAASSLRYRPPARAPPAAA